MKTSQLVIKSADTKYTMRKQRIYPYFLLLTLSFMGMLALLYPTPARAHGPYVSTTVYWGFPSTFSYASYGYGGYFGFYSYRSRRIPKIQPFTPINYYDLQALAIMGETKKMQYMEARREHPPLPIPAPIPPDLHPEGTPSGLTAPEIEILQKE